MLDDWRDRPGAVRGTEGLQSLSKEGGQDKDALHMQMIHVEAAFIFWFSRESDLSFWGIET